MNRLSAYLPILICVAGIGLPGCAAENIAAPETLLERARRIHDEVLVLDTHVDIPANFATDQVDPGLDGELQVDLPKMIQGGMDAAFFIVYVPQTRRSEENYIIAQQQAMTKFKAIHRFTEILYPDQIELAYSASDVRRIHRSGKRAALIGIENGYVIGQDLKQLQVYYDLGARYMSLTHNGHNDLADSCCIKPDFGDTPSEHEGLSDLGRQVVLEMNRLGMMVDVAHAAKQTVLEIAAVSAAPIITSHHALRHFVDIPRNLDDEMLLAIKMTGGVVQIVAFDTYLKEPPKEKTAALSALREKYAISGRQSLADMSPEKRLEYTGARAEINAKWPRASVETFVDHIQYAVDLLGIDHVGIVSDFNGGGGIIGWDNARETFNVTHALVKRGYDEDEIEKIWGGNLLRVLAQVEQVAVTRRSRLP